MRIMAIWSKGDDHTDALVHAFTVGEDFLHDRTLAPYDLIASLAHARMLGSVGLLDATDASMMRSGLIALHREFLAGEWTIDAKDEDVHSKIESLLTVRIGEAGKRLHTGRSRNDQVLTAIRLWQRHTLCQQALDTISTARIAARAGPALRISSLPRLYPPATRHALKPGPVLRVHMPRP